MKINFLVAGGCRTALPYQHRVYSYIDRGFYVEQLRRLWSYFSRKQTLILKNDDLKHNHRKVLNKISSFLNIDKFPVMDYRPIHSIPYRSPLNRDDWTYLMNLFEYKIRQLERLLGWDCSDWLVSENEYGLYVNYEYDDNRITKYSNGK